MPSNVTLITGVLIAELSLFALTCANTTTVNNKMDAVNKIFDSIILDGWEGFTICMMEFRCGG